MNGQPSPYSDNTPSPHRMAAEKLTLGLVCRRNDIRRLFGARYVKAVLPFRQVIRGIASSEGISLADAGLKIARDLDAAGYDPSCAIAAMVDEIEGK